VKEATVLNAVTATLEPPPATAASLASRDEFGPITRGPGLFTAGAVRITADERDELGRRLHLFVPDGDLLGPVRGTRRLPHRPQPDP
jgi:hypothetical protein